MQKLEIQHCAKVGMKNKDQSVYFLHTLDPTTIGKIALSLSAKLEKTKVRKLAETESVLILMTKKIAPEFVLLVRAKI